MSVRGTLANLNAALNGITYTPTSRYVGTSTISVSVKDSIDGLSGSGSVTVSVKQVGRAVQFAAEPVLAAPHVAPTAPSSTGQEPTGGTTVLYVTATNDGIVFNSSPASSSTQTSPEKTVIPATTAPAIQPPAGRNRSRFTGRLRNHLAAEECRQISQRARGNARRLAARPAFAMARPLRRA